MGVPVSLFLIAAGAILAFAVDVSTTAVNLHTVGWILMVVGLLGLVASLLFWDSLNRRGPAPRRPPHP